MSTADPTESISPDLRGDRLRAAGRGLDRCQGDGARRPQVLSFEIAYETYVDGNWEIFAMNADGSQSKNITSTPKVNEHYPLVSPDGSKMAFSVDTGRRVSSENVRSLWVMDIDGRNRKKIADHAREPFWGPGGKVIGFLPRNMSASA